MKKTILTVVMISVCLGATAQGYVTTEYLTTSNFNDDSGSKLGSGDMLKVAGRYTLPLSVKRDDNGKVKAWTATLSAAYATMDNKDGARLWNPDEIVNASLNISHTRPLGERWRLIASLGAGIYSAPDDIAWRSILANGAVIFAYQLTDNLSIGIGGGLTNSYGVPMVLPMSYLSWKTNGRMKVTIDLATGMKVKAETTIGKHFALALTAIELDGMSAVMSTDDGTKIYSQMRMKSVLTASWHFAPKMALNASFGGNWLRTVKMSDRSLKGFFKSFGDDENKRRFSPALLFSAGFTYGL